MRKLRLICIWHKEQVPDTSADTSAATSEDRQSDERIGCDEPIVDLVTSTELICIHKKNRELCVICSRNWAEPQTGRLPYRPKAA